MLITASKFPCYVLTYEELMHHGSQKIAELATFLNIEIGSERITDIARKTNFETMKKSSGNASHFRKGKTNDHQAEINDFHKVMVRQAIVNYTPNLPQLIQNRNQRQGNRA